MKGNLNLSRRIPMVQERDQHIRDEYPMVLLNTDVEATEGGLAMHVLTICNLWKEGRTGIIEDIVTMLRAEEQKREYDCPRDSLEFLKNRNMLTPTTSGSYILHLDAERVARAILRDYMEDRKHDLRNPVKDGERLFVETGLMMLKALNK